MAMGVSIIMVWTNQVPEDYANFLRLSFVRKDMQSLGIVTAAILTIGQGYLPPILLERDFLVSEQKVLFLGAPRAILEGTSFDLRWSANGRYLAVHSERLPDEDVLAWLQGKEVEPTRRIVIHDVQSETTRTFALAKGERATVIGFMGGVSPALLFKVSRTLPSGPNRDMPEDVEVLMRWGASAPRPEEIASLTIGLTDVEVWPSRTFGVIVDYDSKSMKTSRAAIFGPQGRPRPIALPMEGGSFQPGGQDTFIYEVTKRDAAGKVSAHSFRLNGAGEFKPLTWVESEVLLAEEQKRKFPDPAAVQIALGGSEAKLDKAELKSQSAWLWMPDKGQVRATLVASDVSQAAFAPTRDAVAYVTRSNLFVRRLIPASREQYERVLENTEKQELMDRAKQVGIAMHIYGTDYDNLLPLENGWQEAVMPYVKDRNLLKGFVFQLGGKDLTKFEDPTRTVMGYIEGKNGRAVVYADSSVKWERRKLP